MAQPAFQATGRTFTLESLADPLIKHMTTNPQTAEHEMTVANSFSTSQRLAAAHNIFVAIVFTFFSAAQIKESHQNSWVAFILSVQITAKGCPKRCLEQLHHFECCRENCPNVELQKPLAFAPRLKQEAEGL